MRKLFVVLAVAGAAVSAVPARAQDATLTVAARPDSRVWLEGTSTIHNWKCTAGEVRATFELDRRVTESSTSTVATPLRDADVVIPVRSLACGNKQMDKNLYKALKAAKFPEIRYSLDRATAATSEAGVQTLAIEGKLMLAGTERSVPFRVQAIRGSDGLATAKGSVPIRMTDFGVKPPTAMFGTIRSGDRVTVFFDVRVALPPVAMLDRPGTVVVLHSTNAGGSNASDAPDFATVAPDSATAVAVARPDDTTPPPDTGRITVEPKKSTASLLPPIGIQHLRPLDRRGINVFEPLKEDRVPFEGFKISFGAAFTQQFQGLDHSNAAAPRVVSGVNQNQLIGIGSGFNNATANAYLNAQLARGIRVALTSYLSSRHHNETWVKDGYLLVDDSPIDVSFVNTMMKYLTLRLGHFEVNYGDAHFRRSDNGNAMYNPLIGNYVMDAFTTEVGGEAYFRTAGFLAMLGVTDGETRGQVTRSKDRSPTILAKLGFDRRVSQHGRIRLTTSMYTTKESVNNALYSGDRAGSRYYSVMENTSSTESAQAWSGAIQPGFASKLRAVVVNPFIECRGLEFFGNFEVAKGRARTETEDRTWRQNVGEVVYRFLPNRQMYVAARYNTANGRLPLMTDDVSVNRFQTGGGWFLTPTLLLKAEYVTQKYNDFPSTDIRNGGKFHGYMVEGVVAF